MGPWLAVVIGLFILGLASPVVGALRAWRHATATLRRIEWEQIRSAELEIEWQAKKDALADFSEFAEVRKVAESDDEYKARLEDQLMVGQQHLAVAQGRVAAFEAEGLIAPTVGNVGDLPAIEARRALRIVLDGNLSNLLLVLAGPVLSTSASIIAIFPAWQLP